MIDSSAIWIKNPLSIAADDASGGIVVREGRIIDLIESGKTPSAEAEVFDASEHVVLPGLINAHHHFYQTLTRSCDHGLNKGLFDWLKSLYPIWAQLEPEMLSLASKLAVAELLLSGCTLSSDHHYLFPSGMEEAIGIQVAAGEELGIRLMITRGSMSLGSEEGGLPPQSVVQSEEAILLDSEQAINRFHQAGKGSMCQIALAPCSPFSVSRDLMRSTAELARRHDVRLHTHLAETKDETHFCLDRFGLRPLDYLESCDWIGDDVWLAHGIDFNADEIIRLGQYGISICHCPTSNMMLGSGFCPVSELEEAGVAVGLGVDGSASNDCSNLAQEMRQAWLLGRLHSGPDSMTHSDAIRLATEGSAACLGRKELGKIEVGARADLSLYRLDELRFSGAENPLAAIVQSGVSRADRVMIEGEWRVSSGEIIGIDLEQLRHQHDRAAKKLMSKYYLS